MEQKYAEPLILCPPMQLNIIKMYILLVFMVYISKKQELLNNHSKKIVSFVTLDLIKRKEYYYERIKCFSSIFRWCSSRCRHRYFVCPGKGEDTRQKIAEILRKKGIRLNRNEMENLVDEIAAEIKGEANE